MKAFWFPRLRQAPWLWGIGTGIPLLILLRSVSSLLWSALFVDLGWSGPVQGWPARFMNIVLRSLFAGALLGGLSSNLVVEGWEANATTVRIFTYRALGVCALFAAWTIYKSAFIIKIVLNPPFGGMDKVIPGPHFIPWQVRWVTVSLMGDVPLLWAVALVISGIIASRRLIYRAKRERQFKPPLSSEPRVTS